MQPVDIVAVSRLRGWGWRAGVSALVLGLVLSRAEWIHMAAVCRRLDPLLAVSALAAMLLIYPCKALRWRALLEGQGQRVRTRVLCMWVFVGNLVNFALPTSVGGDSSRFYFLQRHGVPFHAAAMSVLMDRLFGWAALGAPLAAGWLLAPSPLRPLVLAMMAGWGGSMAVGGLLWAALRTPHPERWLAALVRRAGPARAFLERHAGELLELARLHAAEGRRGFWIFAVSAGIHGLLILSDFLGARALHLPLDWGAVAALYLAQNLASMLPVSLNGIGVREGVAVAVLAPLGVGWEEAVVLSLLFFAVRLVTALPGALFLAVSPKRAAS